MKIDDESYKNSMTHQVGASLVSLLLCHKVTQSLWHSEFWDRGDKQYWDQKRSNKLLITICVPGYVPTQKFNRHPLSIPLCTPIWFSEIILRILGMRVGFDQSYISRLKIWLFKDRIETERTPIFILSFTYVQIYRNCVL